MTNSTKLDTSKMLGFDQKGEILFGIAHSGEKGQSQTITAGSKAEGVKLPGFKPVGDVKG